MTNLCLFHTPCGGLRTYNRFGAQTRVPPVKNLVLLMHLVVVLVPAGCLPSHDGRLRGRPARGRGQALGGSRDPLCVALRKVAEW